MHQFDGVGRSGLVGQAVVQLNAEHVHEAIVEVVLVEDRDPLKHPVDGYIPKVGVAGDAIYPEVTNRNRVLGQEQYPRVEYTLFRWVERRPLPCE